MHIAIETIDGHFAKNPFNEFHFHVTFLEKLAVKQHGFRILTISQCLKITQNVTFEVFDYFPPIFVLI